MIVVALLLAMAWLGTLVVTVALCVSSANGDRALARRLADARRTRRTTVR